MFDGASNLQLGGEILKIIYPKVSVMRGVEHTVSLFLNDVSEIPVVNQMLGKRMEPLYVTRATYQMLGKRMEPLYVIDFLST